MSGKMFLSLLITMLTLASSSLILKELLEKTENIISFEVIAHSGGGVDGYNYTNSLEGYNFAYEHGTRIFDADIRFSSDNVLVLRHEWGDNIGTENNGKQMDYNTFKNSKIFGKYTPMSFEDMLNFMNTHSDVNIFLDVKEPTEYAYKYLVNYVKEKGLTHLLDRMVPSFYNYKDYNIINNIYNFPKYSIRKYPNVNLDIDEILQFCVNNNIKYLNIMQQYFTKEVLNEFHEKGIKVIVAVIDKDKACEYVKMGVDGIVSNDFNKNDVHKC